MRLILTGCVGLIALCLFSQTGLAEQHADEWLGQKAGAWVVTEKSASRNDKARPPMKTKLVAKKIDGRSMRFDMSRPDQEGEPRPWLSPLGRDGIDGFGNAEKLADATLPIDGQDVACTVTRYSQKVGEDELEETITYTVWTAESSKLPPRMPIEEIRPPFMMPANTVRLVYSRNRTDGREAVSVDLIVHSLGKSKEIAGKKIPCVHEVVSMTIKEGEVVGKGEGHRLTSQGVPGRFVESKMTLTAEVRGRENKMTKHEVLVDFGLGDGDVLQAE